MLLDKLGILTICKENNQNWAMIDEKKCHLHDLQIEKDSSIIWKTSHSTSIREELEVVFILFREIKIIGVNHSYLKWNHSLSNMNYLMVWKHPELLTTLVKISPGLSHEG